MKTLNMFYLIIYWTQKAHNDFIFLCSIVLLAISHSSNHEYHCWNLQDNRAVVWIFIALLRFSFDSPSYFWVTAFKWHEACVCMSLQAEMNLIRSELLTTVLVMLQVSWDVTLFQLVDSYWYFGDTAFLWSVSVYLWINMVKHPRKHEFLPNANVVKECDRASSFSVFRFFFSFFLSFFFSFFFPPLLYCASIEFSHFEQKLVLSGCHPRNCAFSFKVSQIVKE